MNKKTAVTVVSLNQEDQVYIVLGIDEHAHDQVLAVYHTFYDAKLYCCRTVIETEFYDLWIEKHPVM